jgi:hypothetical protein
MVYVGLDEKDQAMSWLEKAYGERSNPSVLMRPCFDPLRSDPRFQDPLHVATRAESAACCWPMWQDMGTQSPRPPRICGR